MIPNKIKLTGTVYIKYIDPIENPKIGDILLLLHDDAISLIKGDYKNTKSSGYIKAKIFDGRIWQNISIHELCIEKENKFIKRQYAINSALLCKSTIMACSNIILYKTYRGHFTVKEYQKTPRNRKVNNGKRI